MTKTTGNFTDFVSFSRASGGTYRDANGDLQTAGVNTPRIDHDEDGNLKGLLIEEARTNLFLNSGNPETQVCSVTPGTSYTLGFTSGAATVDLDETIAATAVDVFVYDTSKDSDGGAWRTGALAQASSWYNETLNTATRGARREFPAVAVIVAEATKVTIYDGDDPALPMWGVWTIAVSTTVGRDWWRPGGRNATSITALNGIVAFGLNSGVGTDIAAGVAYISFSSDTVGRYSHSSLGGGYGLNAASGTKTSDLPNLFGVVLVNSSVNDVAMTVLPTAPIGPVTGLPVPTIAVATAGGVSVIKDDGTVVDSVSAVVTSVSIDQEKLSYVRVDECRVIALANIVSDGFTYDRRYNTGPTISASFLPQPLSGSNKPLISDTVSFAASSGLTRLYEDTSSQTKGMVAYTTSTYNTGWMNGNIKGAFLSSTDTASLVGSGELVTNGTFDTDTAWTKGTGWTISGGVATHAAGTGSDLEQTGVVSAGKTYILTLDVTAVRAASTLYVVAGPSNTYQEIQPTVTVGTKVATFVAPANGKFAIRLGGAADADIDNISVKLADADRSVNNKGLIVNGTITRSPVATGAELVAYSGFSASNYLEQPYNSALDFGTGDFCVMGWVNGTKSGQIFDRFDAAETGARFSIVLSGSYTRFFTSSGFFDASALSDGPSFVVMLRRSGVLYGYINGLLVGTVACTGSLTNTSANLRVGTRANTSASPFAGSLALLRISATAPTADQIAKIYEDEKVLFQQNAACTLYGASDAVTALAHDPDTGLLHVGTSAGRSVFQGLRRINNTTTGVTTAISATNGIIAEQ